MVCVLLIFHVRSIDLNDMNESALYSDYSPAINWRSGRPSSSYYFVGSQADNLLYLSPHHTRATVSLRPPTQAQITERELGILIRQATARRDQYRLHIASAIVPRRRPCPAAQAHLHSHIRQPRQRPSQNNNCPQAAHLKRCTRALELDRHGRQWWRWWVGIVGRGC